MLVVADSSPLVVLINIEQIEVFPLFPSSAWEHAFSKLCFAIQHGKQSPGAPGCVTKQSLVTRKSRELAHEEKRPIARSRDVISISCYFGC
jgi:hypothetical protein